MSWAFYDDALPSNRKVAWLRAHGTPGIAALGLHLLLNTWSRHEGMQGFIPSYVPEQQAGRHWRALVNLLADDGCGMLVACDGGWMINDYDDYGKDGGISATDRKARLSKVRAEAGRAGGLAKAGKRSSNSASKPVAVPEQTSSPTPKPPNSSTSPGSGNAPAGSMARIVTLYVDACRGAHLPAPEQSQARVEKSARSLYAQGFPLVDIEQAAVIAGREGWTDLATQLQRNAANSRSTVNGGKESTADLRFMAGNTLATELERKAIG